MATQTVVFFARRTPTSVKVRNLSSGTEVSGSSITQVTEGLFTAQFASLSGDYSLHVFDGAAVIGLGTVYAVTDTATTFDEVGLVRPLPWSWAAGITLLKNWLGALAGKTADTSTRAEINATTAGAGYNETTDSQEAIRERGDAAWTTGAGGGGGSTATEIADEVEARLAGQALEIINPYPTGGTIRTVQGTAYKASLGNRIEWPDANATWPVLTGATITVKVQQASGVDTFTGVVVSGTGTKRVGLELEEADTTGIAVTTGEVETAWRYIVTATISGDVIKLAESKWISASQPA